MLKRKLRTADVVLYAVLIVKREIFGYINKLDLTWNPNFRFKPASFPKHNISVHTGEEETHPNRNLNNLL